MHPNPAYRGADAARNLAFARMRGFGVLTMAGPDGPLASHIPFMLSDDGDALHAHVVRSNPIRRALDDGDIRALVAVSGPDGYVSPDWYGIADQVPTWNYVAVHLFGPARLRPADALRGHLRALSARFEAALPKAPWTLDKMTPETLAKMERMIVPIEMRIERVEGTWKLNQNKDAAARLGAADAIAASTVGAELGALSALMRSPPV